MRLPAYVPGPLRAQIASLSLTGSADLPSPPTTVPGNSFMVTRSGTDAVVLSAAAPSAQKAVQGMVVADAEDLTLFTANTPASGTPSISGTPQVGETLIAITSGITDADGLPNPLVPTYQWHRSSDESFTTPFPSTLIDGATADRYLLGESDLGTYIIVEVVFNDLRSERETLSSGATAVVTASGNSAARGAPAFTGIVQVGETLTATPGDIADDDGLPSTDDFSYQWHRGTTADFDTSVAPAIATGGTYTLTDEDTNAYLLLMATFTDAGGSEESLSSQASLIAPRPNSPATGELTILGTAQVGTALMADISTLMDADGLSPSFEPSYQWYQSDTENFTPNSANAITGATSRAYTPIDRDVGSYILVVVQLTDSRGFPESLRSVATAPVLALGNRMPTGNAVIAGTNAVGKVLSVDLSTIADPDTLPMPLMETYQWYRSTAENFMPSASNAIASATAPTYTQTLLDAGLYLKVVVNFVDGREFGEQLISDARLVAYTDLCLRTPAVRTAILAALPGISDCSDARTTHLATISALTIATSDLSLQPADFDDLSALTTLNMQFGAPLSAAVTAAPVPHDLFSEVAAGLESLTLTQTDQAIVSALPADLFSNMNSLLSLAIEMPSATSPLPKSLFEPTTSLTSLNLSGNNLTALPDGIFTAPTALTSLDLRGNDLTALPINTFATLTALTSLNLRGNDLTALPDGIFTTLTALLSLDLRGNDLRALPDGVFTTLTALRELNLANNALATLALRDFEPLTSLVILDVSGNTGAPLVVPARLNVLDNGSGTSTAVISILVPRFIPAGLLGQPYDLSVTGGSASSTTGEPLSSVVANTPFRLTQEEPTIPLSISVAPQPPVLQENGLQMGSPPELTLFIPNREATGRPDVSGIPRVDEVLMAGPGDIADADGLGAFSYQWHRSTDPNFEPDPLTTAIASANLSDYRLKPADQGAYIRVVVSFTDERRFDETTASEVIGPIVAPVNTPATGSLTIAGSPAVGQGLTAVTGTITDANNPANTNIVFTYQWHRSSTLGFDVDSDAMSTTAITGANLQNYRLQSADEGAYIRVEASFTDGFGFTERFVSGSTIQVGPPSNTQASGRPAITGMPYLGQQLTAEGTLADANGLGTFSYQWHRSNIASFAPNGSTAIAEATNSTYTLTPFDIGQYLIVVVSYVDGIGFPEEHSSTAVRVAPTDLCSRTPAVRDAIVTAITGPSTCSAVTQAQLNGLTGTLDLGGAALTEFATGDFADLVSLTSLNLSGNAITTVDGLFRDLRSLTSLQLNNTNLSSSSLSSSDFASLISLTSLEITGGNNLTTSLPANILASSPNLTQLILADLGLTSLEAGVFSPLSALTTLDISGNSLSSLDAGTFASLSSLTTLDISGNSLSSLPAGIFAPLPALTTLDISGNTATSFAIPYQIIQTGGSGSGATQIATLEVRLPAYVPASLQKQEASLTLTGDAMLSSSTTVPDTGNSFTVTRSGTTEVVLSATAPSSQTPERGMVVADAENLMLFTANTLPSGVPTISGMAQAGEILVASTADITDADGLPNPLQPTYQWHQSTTLGFRPINTTRIAGATADRYLLSESNLDAYILVEVSFTDRRGNRTTLSSAQTAQVTARANRSATGAPAFTGTAGAGETLTATQGDVADDDGLPDPLQPTYKWHRGDSADFDTSVAPAIATGPTYMLTDDDAGNYIRVEINFKDTLAAAESLFSKARLIAPRANSQASGEPAITGIAQVGETLMATRGDIADDDGLPNSLVVSYQWHRNTAENFPPNSANAIAGANASNYTLIDRDTNNYILVVASFTDSRGFPERRRSVVTAPVTMPTNRPATGTPGIEGISAVGEDFTIDLNPIADTDTLPIPLMATYQWHRGAVAGFTEDGDNAIAGATAPSYTQAPSDAGKYLRVVVNFVDGRGFDERLVSGARLVATTDLCQRTPAVRTAIVAALPSSADCSDVTATQLAGISALTISVDDAALQALQAGDFAGLSALTTLDMQLGSASPATATPLPEDLFTEVAASLESLTLTETRQAVVSALPANLFAGMSSLRTLVIELPSATTLLPSGLFTPLTALTSLDLSDNALTALPDTVFTPLTALTSLDLSGNALTALPDAVFTPLTALTSLDLSGNALTALPDTVFTPLTALTSLDLSDNALTALPDAVFTPLTALTVLNLANNALATLNFNAFAGLADLTTLDVSGDGNTGAPFDIGYELIVTGSGAQGGMATATLQVRAPAYTPSGLRALMAALTIDGGDTQATISTSAAPVDTAFTVTQVATDPVVISATLPDSQVGGLQFTATAATLMLFASNSEPTGAPEISGTARVGQTLTADFGNTADADGLPAALMLIYQWHSSTTADFDPSGTTAIDGALGPTYKVEEGDIDRYIKVVASFTDSTGNEESVASTPTDRVVPRANTPATGLPRIVGNLRVGQTLTVSLEEIADAEDGLPDTLELTYEWHSNDGPSSTYIPDGTTLISDAINPTYTIQEDRLGQYIRVIIRFRDGRNFTETLTSLATVDPVAERTNTAATGTLTLTDSASVGKRLGYSIANLEDAVDGLPERLTFTPQWHRSTTANFTPTADTAITGATNDTYALAEEDLGYYINLEVGFVDAFDFPENLALLETPLVTERVNTPATGTPEISGNRGSGEILSGEILRVITTDIADDEDGVPDPVVPTGYQWHRGDSADFMPGDETIISGEAMPTYTATDGDEGMYLLVVIDFIDTREFPEKINSDAVLVHYTDLCSRTPAIRDALVAAVSDSATCSSVTKGDLANIETLTVPASDPITSIPQTGDFAGLSTLTNLTLAFGAATGTATAPGTLPDNLFREVNGTLTNLSMVRASGRSAVVSALGVNLFAEMSLLTTVIIKLPTVSTLPAGVFRNLSSLDSLDMSESGLTFLSTGAFAGLNVLKTLNLSSNSLLGDALQAGVFSNLTALATLNISSSRLTSLPANMFAGLSSLTRLNLSNNSLSSLPSGAFSGLSSLTSLNLNRSIAGEDNTLPASVFSELVALESLDLRNNKLSSLPTGVFDSLTAALSTLDLSVNSLATDDISFDAFADHSELETLYLQGQDTGEDPFTVPLTLLVTAIDTSTSPHTATVEVSLPGYVRVPLRNEVVTLSATGATPSVSSVQISGAPVSFTLTRENTEQVVLSATAPPSQTSTNGLVIGDAAPLTLFAANTPASGQPTVVGTAQAGQLLMTELDAVVDTDGLPAPLMPTYQWQRSDISDFNDANASVADINSATAATYELTDDDTNNYVRVVISFTDNLGSPEELASDPTPQIAVRPNQQPIGLPTIDGIVAVKEDLTAKIDEIMDADGLPVEADRYSYQWHRLSTPESLPVAPTAIEGADGATYTLKPKDQNSYIRVVVSYSDERGAGEMLNSDATVPVAQPLPNIPAEGEPTITGIARVGEDLTAVTNSVGSVITDANGLGEFSYQWESSALEDFTGAPKVLVASSTDAKTYRIADDDAGNYIRVVVSFTDGRDFLETLPSKPRLINTPVTGTLTISGMPVVPNELEAEVGQIADEDGPANTDIDFTYQWQRSDTA